MKYLVFLLVFSVTQAKDKRMGIEDESAAIVRAMLFEACEEGMKMTARKLRTELSYEDKSLILEKCNDYSKKVTK